MGWKTTPNVAAVRTQTSDGWKITFNCPCHGQATETFNSERTGTFTGTCPGGNPITYGAS